MNTTTTTSVADTDRVRDRSTQWLADVARGDVDSIARYYADDGSFLVPNVPLAQGRDAVRGVWSALLSAPEFSLRWEPHSIQLSHSGDMACEIGSYSLRMRPGDAVVEDEGKYVVVWRKEGGEWLVYADIVNSSRAANAG
jgi:ketosteroid isomerase-like protein